MTHSRTRKTTSVKMNSVSLLCLFLPVFISQHLHSSAQILEEERFIIVDNLPICNNDQFVTFNGSQLICRTMPERECNCPEILPDPPLGCQNFAPPAQGGFVCLNTEDTIYCSVQCDNTGDFDSFPRNPYQCGPETNFLWVDFVDDTYNQLPQCNSFRLPIRPIFQETNYFPVPCNELSDEQITTKFEELLSDIQWIYRCADCQIEQAYIRCP